MKNEDILPALDVKVLKEKANEFAMEGAISQIKDFYTGYQSPYKEEIKKQLEKQEMGFGIKLPNIIGLINDSLTKEIELIAHTAVAKSYVPMVQHFLTRAEKEMKLSDILKEFIEKNYNASYDECSCELKESEHGWIELDLSFEKNKYHLSLHENKKYGEDKEKEEDAVKKYHLLGLPYDRSSYDRNMEICIGEDQTLKIPFSQQTLQDRFVAFIGTLVIANTEITIDCEGFEREMFPEECYCD